VAFDFSSARIEKKIEKAGNLELLEGVKDINWLLVSTPLKNMKVKWDYYSQYIYIYTRRTFAMPNAQKHGKLQCLGV